jgi:hypothetical protein
LSRPCKVLVCYSLLFHTRIVTYCSFAVLAPSLAVESHNLGEVCCLRRPFIHTQAMFRIFIPHQNHCISLLSLESCLPSSPAHGEFRGSVPLFHITAPNDALGSTGPSGGAAGSSGSAQAVCTQTRVLLNSSGLAPPSLTVPAIILISLRGRDLITYLSGGKSEIKTLSCG